MTDEESVIALLRDPAHSFPVPDSLVRKWGLENAIFYCYLAKKQQLLGGKRIPLSVKDVVKETRINDYKQRKFLKQLAKMGLVTIDFVSNKRFVEILKYPAEIKNLLKP